MRLKRKGRARSASAQPPTTPPRTRERTTRTRRQRETPPPVTPARPKHEQPRSHPHPATPPPPPTTTAGQTQGPPLKRREGRSPRSSTTNSSQVPQPETAGPGCSRSHSSPGSKSSPSSRCAQKHQHYDTSSTTTTAQHSSADCGTASSSTTATTARSNQPSTVQIYSFALICTTASKARWARTDCLSALPLDTPSSSLHPTSRTTATRSCTSSGCRSSRRYQHRRPVVQ